MQTRKPIAVLISDVHYNINTLPLADAAMRQAITSANSLRVPLIVAGDLHDTKANLRGECIAAMLETFSLLRDKAYIIVGNHDRINEKAPAHSLEFLRSYEIIDKPFFNPQLTMLPYFHSPDELRECLKQVPDGCTIIMHQGLESSNAGDYIQDKSAIKPLDVEGRNIISGHYHTRQTIALPNGGAWNYVGNPYTLNYAEANDPPKGFQILHDDGSLEFVPTNLRKHMRIQIVNAAGGFMQLGTRPLPVIGPQDLVQVKMVDTREALQHITKAQISEFLGGVENLRLDFEYLDINNPAKPELNATGAPLLDSIIEGLQNTSAERKERIKALWRAKV